MVATSYEWYTLAKQLNNGTMLLNIYNYSSTTVRHYYKMRKQLTSLGLDIVEIEAPKGLQDLTSAVNLYKRYIADLESAITKKGSRSSTNAVRSELIKTYKGKIHFITNIQFSESKPSSIERIMYNMDGK